MRIDRSSLERLNGMMRAFLYLSMSSSWRELGSMSGQVFPWAKGNACVSRQIIPTPRKSLVIKVNNMEKVFPGSAQTEKAVGFWFETPMAYGCMRFPSIVWENLKVSP